MKPLGRLHIGIVLLALVNMLPAVEVENSWWIFTLGATAAGLSLLLIREDGTSRLPTFVTHIGLLLAGAFLIWEMFGAHEEPTVYIIDLSHFIVFLGCFKFFELRAHRDYALMATISFLLLVISGFASGSPVFGAVLLIDLTFGLAWLMAFQSERAVSALARKQIRAVERLQFVRLPAARVTIPASRPGFAVPALLWAVGLSLFAGIIFLAVPRGWGRGLFVKIQNIVPTSVTGFSGELALTDNTLVEDVTPVMRVKFTRNGRVLKEDDISPLMRGKAFERYERGRWVQRPQHRVAYDIKEGDSVPLFTRIQPEDLGTKVIDQEVWLDDTSSGCLFSMYPPLDFRSEDIPRVRLRPTDLSLQTSNRFASSVHYKVRTIDELAPDRRLLLDPPPERPMRPARQSAIHPDVRNFATDFFQRHGDPADPLQRRQLATAIREYLCSGEFEYTLSRGVRNRSRDSIRDFLFYRKQGHCEYFASTMAVVCQAGGIPARVVTGFAGGVFNPEDGSFTFRRSDAHAWVEIFIADEGWVAFDPSPTRNASRREAETGLLAAIQNWLHAIELKWSTTIVAFDAQTWATLVEHVGDFVDKLSREDTKAGSSSLTIRTLLWGPDLLPLWQRFFYWLLMALVVAFLVLVLRAIGILSLMLKENLGLGRGSRSVLVRTHDAKFYDRLLLLLASKGHVKPTHRTPLEFATDLASACHDLEEMPLMTRWFYESQYGQKTLSHDQRQRIRGLLARLREDGSFGARTA